MKKKLSIIIPCYNEEENIKLIYQDIKDEENNIFESGISNFEVLFVNDGSKDSTIEEIKKIAKKDSRIRYISFSRNFGKESSMYAGFKNVTGDYVVIMDADGQDPVNLIPKMIEIIINDKYECVATRRKNRKGEPIIRSFFARKFYKLINKMSDTEVVDGARDFRMFTRKYLDALLELAEYNRFSKGLFSWIGFKTKWIEYQNIERKAGKTKWSFWKLFKYSIDGIIAFSTTPLLIVSMIGFFICLIAIIFLIWIIISRLVYGNEVAGWTSLACLITFIGGITIFSMGIVSQYIAKTYSEVKKRPIYIIDEDNLKR